MIENPDARAAFREVALVFTSLMLSVVVTASPSAMAASFGEYDKIHVASVRIDEALENRRNSGFSRARLNQERAVRGQDLSDKSADLHEALIRALETDFEITEAPGEGVLSIQPVMLELRSSRPTFADFSSRPGLSARSEYAGGARIAFEFSDGEEILTPFETSYFGDIERRRRKVGIWEDADRAFRVISRRLVRHLGS